MGRREGGRGERGWASKGTYGGEMRVEGEGMEGAMGRRWRRGRGNGGRWVEREGVEQKGEGREEWEGTEGETE